MYIERKILIKINCQQVQAGSINNYRVLGIFRKYYNKWFDHMESEKNMWDKYSNKYHIIARMMQKGGVEFKKSELEEAGIGVQGLYFLSSTLLKC